MKEKKEMNMNIGAAAKLAKVSVSAIRFYERSKVMPEPARMGSGYRVYTPMDVARLQLIEKMKRAGFTLKETAVLLSVIARHNCRNCKVPNLLTLKSGCLARQRAEICEQQKRVAKITRHCAARRKLAAKNGGGAMCWIINGV